MLDLRTLGGLSLTVDGAAAGGAAQQRKTLALLALLAAGGRMSRDKLIAYLWPESDAEHARGLLKQACYALRRDLGAHDLFLGTTELRLNTALIASDIQRFEAALEQRDPDRAAALYGGPFLDGFYLEGSGEFERWVEDRRAQIAKRAAAALEQLATAATGRGEHRGATEFWRRLLELDPLSSCAALGLMRALDDSGERAEAIRQGRSFEALVRAELGAEPPEVSQLLQQLRDQTGPRGRPSSQPALAVPRRAEGSSNATGREEALEREVPREQSRQDLHTRERPRRVSWITVAVAVTLIGGIVVVQRWIGGSTAIARSTRTAIGVLPFRYLGADSSHAYLADGLHDELLTQLTRVRVLRIIGRTSVGTYHETAKSLRQVGEELGAGSLVEASVEVEGNRLRVIAQLVDPVTQEVLWVEHYDRTLKDVFAVQSDIARQVARSVGANLSGSEAGAIAAAPTRNAEAYQFYLQGLDYWRRPRESGGVASALRLFERAVALDSSFALAHAALSLVEGDMVFTLADPSPTRMGLQRREAEMALRLAPDLPRSHLAMGLVYLTRYENTKALNEFGLARSGAPSDVDTWEWIGYAQRRVANWDSALVAFERASELDPRDIRVIMDRGYALEWVRRYEAAVGVFRHAQALAPDLVRAHVEIGWVFMKWKGDWDTLNLVLSGLPVDDELLGAYLIQRKADTVLALLRSASGRGDGPRLGYTFRAGYIAEAHRLRGDSAVAHAYFDSLATFLDSLVRARPDDWRVHGARGKILARRGRRTDAMREAQWLEHSDVYLRDAVQGASATADHSAILADVGETDAALADLERLLSHPSYISVPEVRVNPMWDPIRKDPRLLALLTRHWVPGGQ